MNEQATYLRHMLDEAQKSIGRLTTDLASGPVTDREKLLHSAVYNVSLLLEAVVEQLITDDNALRNVITVLHAVERNDPSPRDEETINRLYAAVQDGKL